MPTLVKNIAGSRTAAFEIMLGTPAIRNLIREDKIMQMLSVMQTGSRVGMRTLDQSLEDLVNQQVITQNVAIQIATHKIQ
jgi:twitching motility protein PilT